jgi:hypothetical protein
LEEGAERNFLLKKPSQGQEEGEREKSLTHPKLTDRQVLIKKLQNGVFWMVRSWVLTLDAPLWNRAIQCCISLKDFLPPPTPSERDILGWRVRGCWVNLARA